MTDSTPQPGDIFIAPDGDGNWADALTFVKPATEAGSGIFTDGKARYKFRFDAIQRPLVGAAGPSSPRTLEPSVPKPLGPSDPGTITRKQNALIHCLRHDLALDIDDVRALTPAGSISMLSQREAARLIERLLGVSTASPKQKAYAMHLAEEAGMDTDRLNRWLEAQFRVKSVDDAKFDAETASKVIYALKRVRVWHEKRKEATG